MFLWEESRYLPYLIINKLEIDNRNIDLSEKNDWRISNQLILKNYESTLNRNWENLKMNISICIDDETGSRTNQAELAKLINKKMKFLNDQSLYEVSLKIVSFSSKNYKSFKLNSFNPETEGLPIFSWSGDVNISSLHLAENLILYPSIIGAVDQYEIQKLNLAGGDSFIKNDGFLINFDDPEDNFGGKDIKFIKIDFNTRVTEKGENYESFIPKRVVNETHYINAEVSNEEPIIFVNTGIDEIKTLYNDYSSGSGLNNFYVPGKQAISNLGVQAWNLTINNIISYCLSEINDKNHDELKQEISQKIVSLNPWYREALEGISREILDNGQELDSSAVMETFLINYMNKPDHTNQKIAEKLNILLHVKKGTLDYSSNLSKLSSRRTK